MKDELSHIRGMSEPFFFAFDLLDKGRQMVCHGVVLTSFVVGGGSENKFQIGNMENDPRGRALIRFIWTNYLRERKNKLDIMVAELEEMITSKKSSLAELQKKINEITKLSNEQE